MRSVAARMSASVSFRRSIPWGGSGGGGGWYPPRRPSGAGIARRRTSCGCRSRPAGCGQATNSEPRSAVIERRTGRDRPPSRWPRLPCDGPPPRAGTGSRHRGRSRTCGACARLPVAARTNSRCRARRSAALAAAPSPRRGARPSAWTGRRHGCAATPERLPIDADPAPAPSRWATRALPANARSSRDPRRSAARISVPFPSPSAGQAVATDGKSQLEMAHTLHLRGRVQCLLCTEYWSNTRPVSSIDPISKLEPAEGSMSGGDRGPLAVVGR